MAKWVHDDVLDASLSLIRNNCDKRVACSAQPTTFAEANATYALADVAVTSADFTLANGDASGRKNTIAAKTGVIRIPDNQIPEVVRRQRDRMDLLEGVLGEDLARRVSLA